MSTSPVSAVPAEGVAPAVVAEPVPRDHAQTKRRAQQIALDLFSHNGYDSTSMREIAEELGVTKAALYYHFAGKEAIVRSIVEDYLQAVNSLVEWSRSEPRPTPDEVLRRWADVVRTDGLRVIRFIQANHRIVRDIHLDGASIRERMESLADALTPGDDSLEAKLRARLAMFALHGVGGISASIDADEDELFDIGLRVAREILDPPRR